MKHIYKTWGVCSRSITVELEEDGRIRSVFVEGGCHGNSQGIQAMVKGQDAREVIARLSGIRCEAKQTSCPDQLSRALREALRAEADDDKAV